MRRDVQEIFRMTPHEKQVMMFSATLSKEIRPVCRKFMQDVIRPRLPSLPTAPPTTIFVPPPPYTYLIEKEEGREVYEVK